MQRVCIREKNLYWGLIKQTFPCSHFKGPTRLTCLIQKESNHDMTKLELNYLKVLRLFRFSEVFLLNCFRERNICLLFDTGNSSLSPSRNCWDYFIQKSRLEIFLCNVLIKLGILQCIYLVYDTVKEVKVVTVGKKASIWQALKQSLSKTRSIPCA